MSDRKGEDSKRPPECERKAGGRKCPHMKEIGGGMEGEQYNCTVCGEAYYLDYEEMR